MVDGAVSEGVTIKFPFIWMCSDGLGMFTTLSLPLLKTYPPGVTCFLPPATRFLPSVFTAPDFPNLTWTVPLILLFIVRFVKFDNPDGAPVIKIPLEKGLRSRGGRRKIKKSDGTDNPNEQKEPQARFEVWYSFPLFRLERIFFFGSVVLAIVLSLRASVCHPSAFGCRRTRPICLSSRSWP